MVPNKINNLNIRLINNLSIIIKAIINLKICMQDLVYINYLTMLIYLNHSLSLTNIIIIKVIKNLVIMKILRKVKIP